MAMERQMTGSCPCGNAHPKPTRDERVQFNETLEDAIRGVEKAWGYANRTPAYHDLTTRIAEIINELTTVQRVV